MKKHLWQELKAGKSVLRTITFICSLINPLSVQLNINYYAPSARLHIDEIISTLNKEEQLCKSNEITLLFLRRGLKIIPVFCRSNTARAVVTQVVKRLN